MKKKVFYFIVPLVIIVAASNFYRNDSSGTAEGACKLSAKEYIDVDKKDALILDVRTPREFDYGHLEGAFYIDIYERSFKDEINKLDKEKTYFVYCKTGIRSRSAVNYMISIGFKNVCDVEGGINYLSRAGAKIVK